ncbi:translation initiation factor IF-2-like [Oenanthe melanoleuca]|uniref:translation initiation factor IF-2-like n=1 Tax=Oenanthe melanoleuca TaxID=2939378 RepID=UPI0024C18A07|nr:translation initiation factor IF-2-like [Oenanthe melanoleuca]
MCARLCGVCGGCVRAVRVCGGCVRAVRVSLRAVRVCGLCVCAEDVCGLCVSLCGVRECGACAPAGCLLPKRLLDLLSILRARIQGLGAKISPDPGKSACYLIPLPGSECPRCPAGAVRALPRRAAEPGAEPAARAAKGRGDGEWDRGAGKNVSPPPPADVSAAPRGAPGKSAAPRRAPRTARALPALPPRRSRPPPGQLPARPRPGRARPGRDGTAAPRWAPAEA